MFKENELGALVVHSEEDWAGQEPVWPRVEYFKQKIQRLSSVRGGGNNLMGQCRFN